MTSLLTVVTPAADRALLTIDELREAAGVADGESDAALLRLGARVAAGIVSSCRVRRAGMTPPTLRLEGLSEAFRLECRTTSLWLSRIPVSAIASVTENGTVLTVADYEVNAASGEVTRLSGDEATEWPIGRVTIAYTAGWAEVPDDLRQAAMAAAGHLWSDRGRDPNVKRERTEGEGEIEYWVAPASDPFLSQDIVDLLAPYTMAVVP